jgi:cytochrome c551/c552
VQKLGNGKRGANFEQVKPLLMKNTCLSCHNANKRQVGPGLCRCGQKEIQCERIGTTDTQSKTRTLARLFDTDAADATGT